MNGITNFSKEFDQHRLVSFVYDPKTKLEGFVAIHRGTLQNPAFGATRIAAYKSKEEALADALRLSKLMSYKAAMAGLKYGGGKGVIILPPLANAAERRELLTAYSRKINYLGGHFITGADVGITQSDLKVMRAASDYMVGVSSDPVKFTAQGMLNGIEICLNEVFGNPSVKGRSFAIQGVGKIGTALLQLTYKQASKIYVADVDPQRLEYIKKTFPKVEIVLPSQIYKQKVDVFSPCALGGSLNPKTITKIKSPIIAGGANNQLDDRTTGELLHKIGILYAPDYVINAGGLISVVDEYEHKKFDSKRTTKRLNNITVMLNNVIKQSKQTNRATNIVADDIAEKIFNNH